VVVVVVNKTVMVIVGAILLAVSIIGIVAYTGMTVGPDTDIVQPDVTFEGPVFTPAQGTEDFVFGQDGNFVATGTGIYEYLGASTYGTLYQSETGYWLIINPAGQVTMSGSPGSTAPEKVTDE
jgi:hypothetical protein